MYNRQLSSQLRHMDFMIWDVIILIISYFIAFYIRFGALAGMDEFGRNQTMIAFILILIYIIVAVFRPAYRDILRRSHRRELYCVISQLAYTFTIFALMLFALQSGLRFSRLVFGYDAIVACILLYIERCLWKRIVRRYMASHRRDAKLLIIADANQAADVISDIRANKWNSFEIIGMVIAGEGETDADIPIVCPFAELREYLMNNVIDEALIYMENAADKKALTDYILELGITVHIGLLPGGAGLPNQTIDEIGGRSVLTASVGTSEWWKLAIKRAVDIIGAIVGIAFTGIIYVFIAPAIRKADPGPAIFTQTRVGKNGRRFKLYKFRSMYMGAEQEKYVLMEHNEMSGPIFKMEKDPRIIPGIGEFIRRSSLDEFPQFINVLKGEMSLVGTRPPLVEEFEGYDTHHKVRLSIKPGITGLWQVSGRSEIEDFEEIVRMDNEYIMNWSLMLDLKILLRTVSVVLRRSGAK